MSDGTTARPSPNIWEHPEVYEIENQALDRSGLLETRMAQLAGEHAWYGDVLDIGCGAGFHLPRFAAHARRVTGVEPHPPLVDLARARVAELDNVRVLTGGAQAVPVAAASIDVAHARWAYFFGPGCEPGLQELARVVRPGGIAFVIDNDVRRSTFGGWFRRQWPSYDPAGIERFWRRAGWQREEVLVGWEMESRADFEAVVRIEFAPQLAEAILAEHPGTAVDYALNLWWRRFE